MSQITFITDGDYVVPYTFEQFAMPHGTTTVMIVENDDGATCTFGMKGLTGTFVPYPNGTIVQGDLIAHGEGITLMVRITGITSNPVRLVYNRLM